MNPLDRMPGPGPRGDRDGIDALHFIGMLCGLTLVLLAIVAIVILLWNSFKVRTEVRALRSEVARLASGEPANSAGSASAAVRPNVNQGPLAIPPAGVRPPGSAAYAVAPGQGHIAPPPYVAPKAAAPKAPRAPRKKPTGPTQ